MTSVEWLEWHKTMPVWVQGRTFLIVVWLNLYIPLLKVNCSFTCYVFFSPGKFYLYWFWLLLFSLMCSGTWAKDSRFRPASPELKCFSLPPLNVTFKCAHRSDAPGSARRPQRPQTRSMATAKPRTNPNKSTQHAYNKRTQYLYIPYIFLQMYGFYSYIDIM